MGDTRILRWVQKQIHLKRGSSVNVKAMPHTLMDDLIGQRHEPSSERVIFDTQRDPGKLLLFSRCVSDILEEVFEASHAAQVLPDLLLSE